MFVILDLSLFRVAYISKVIPTSYVDLNSTYILITLKFTSELLFFSMNFGLWKLYPYSLLLESFIDFPLKPILSPVFPISVNSKYIHPVVHDKSHFWPLYLFHTHIYIWDSPIGFTFKVYPKSEYVSPLPLIYFHIRHCNLWLNYCSNHLAGHSAPTFISYHYCPS